MPIVAHRRFCVLVSGDSGFFSLSKTLTVKLLENSDLELRNIPAISSLQYFCAKLNMSWDNIKINLDNITYFSSNCLILSNLSIDIDFTKVKYIGFCPFSENKIYNIKLKECKLRENAFAVVGSSNSFSACIFCLNKFKFIRWNNCFM